MEDAGLQFHLGWEVKLMGVGADWVDDAGGASSLRHVQEDARLLSEHRKMPRNYKGMRRALEDSQEST